MFCSISIIIIIDGTWPMMINGLDGDERAPRRNWRPIPGSLKTATEEWPNKGAAFNGPHEL